MRNIHIYPSPFTHESRILKEANTLHTQLGFTELLLVGVKSKGLPSRERVDDVTTIYRLGPGKGSGGLAKLLMHIFWCVHVFFFSLRRRPDCINCHSLPVLPIGVAIKFLTGAKLVYDAHELETEVHSLTGVKKRIAKSLERALIGYIDLLVVVSPSIGAWYEENYGVRDYVVVLNAPRYELSDGRHDGRRSFGNVSARRIALYQGALIGSRGIDALIRAAPAFEEAGYILFFMGNGPMRARLEEIAQKNSNIRVRPAVPPDQLLKITAGADLGIHPINGDCLNHEFCLPNKLFEYLIAGLPVLVSDLPEMREVVEGNKVGLCANDWEIATVADALMRIDAMRGPALDQRIKNAALRYCWSEQEKQLVAGYRAHVLRAV